VFRTRVAIMVSMPPAALAVANADGYDALLSIKLMALHLLSSSASTVVSVIVTKSLPLTVVRSHQAAPTHDHRLTFQKA